MKGGKKAKSSTLKRFRKTLKKKGGKKGRKTIRKSHRMHNRSRKMRGGDEYEYDDTILEIQGDDEGDNFNFSTLPRYTQLKDLYIYSYKMTTLPELPASLKNLYFDNCPFLIRFPELPATLTHLICFKCPLITVLPELPATLTDLHIEDFSSLVELPDLHHTQLKYLNCSGCQLLTALPELPATLKYLNCSDCPLLTALPELPATLTELSLPQNVFFDEVPVNFEGFPENVQDVLLDNFRENSYKEEDIPDLLESDIPELLESDITINTNEPAYDVISGDVVIKDYIEENRRNVAIKLGNTVFLADLDAIQRIKEDATRYECYVADTMRPENINRKPEETLFNLKSIGIPAGYGYLMQIEKMLQQQNNSRFYALEKSDKSVASVVSKAILEGTTQYVSASHCQAGQGGDVYNIRIAKGEMVAVGGRKRKTRKRKAGGKRTV